MCNATSIKDNNKKSCIYVNTYFNSYSTKGIFNNYLFIQENSE